jgi:hypothetical protein
MSESEARQQQLLEMDRRANGISGSVHAELLRMQQQASGDKAQKAMGQVIKTFQVRRPS